MDVDDLNVEQTRMRLEQLRHQVGLHHSDLQRRFVLALTLAGGVFLSLVRAEVPAVGVIAAVPALGWAGWEAQRINRLSKGSQASGEDLIRRLDHPRAEGSRGKEDTFP